MTYLINSNENGNMTKCVLVLHGCFKFCDQNIVAKVVRGQSKDSLLLEVITCGSN